MAHCHVYHTWWWALPVPTPPIGMLCTINHHPQGLFFWRRGDLPVFFYMPMPTVYTTFKPSVMSHPAWLDHRAENPAAKHWFEYYVRLEKSYIYIYVLIFELHIHFPNINAAFQKMTMHVLCRLYCFDLFAIRRSPNNNSRTSHHFVGTCNLRQITVISCNDFKYLFNDATLQRVKL